MRGHKGSELKFEQVPFNHPLFVMYSSGTTGTPKCMVHSAGVSSLFTVCFMVVCVFVFMLVFVIFRGRSFSI